MDELLEAVAKTAPGAKLEYRLCVPYSDGSVLNELHTNEKVLEEKYTGSGTELRVLLDRAAYGRLKKYIV